MGCISVTIEDRIATVTLNRPPVNAVTPAENTELAAVFHSFGQNTDVHVAILTAVGDRAFMAGIDLRAVDTREALATERIDPGSGMRDAFWAIYDCAVPVIAAVNGPAIGAGLAYAAVCDIIVASEGATFSTTEINVGLLGASSQLSLLVPRHKVRELFFTGESISAAELRRLGVVRQVVPAGAFDEYRVGAGDVLGREEPNCAEAGEGVDEPRGVHGPQGRVPDGTGLLDTIAPVRGLA